MEKTVSYWLISIQESSIVVSLVDNNQLISPGPVVKLEDLQSETISISADKSLAQSALSANLPEEKEPNFASFIVPPNWIATDGKIIDTYLKLVERLCKDLTLKPLGFFASDEAIVEESNKTTNFPSSFVLINIDNNNLNLSLVYLGKIKNRTRAINIEGNFPQKVESILNQLNSEFTLPPQIIIYGDIDDSITESFNNYPWINKNIETFLHFPEIKILTESELIDIFFKAISFQINPNITKNNQETIELKEDESESSSSSLCEVDMTDFGFNYPSANFDNLEEIKIEQNYQPQPVIESEYKPVRKFSFPKINFKFINPKLFHINIKANFLLVIIPIFLIIFTVIFFSTADITIFVTPYKFSKKIKITLDPLSTNIDLEKNTIPVKEEKFTSNLEVSTNTTGKKTIGEKSKGEINIINSQYNTVNFTKGTVLTDGNGHNFELNNDIQVASASADLNANPPVSVLGQTKSIVVATDIGPEYNIGQDTKLTFKSISSSQVIAKTNQPFTGGAKEEINAVSKEDISNLETQISDKTQEEVDTKTNKITDIIQNTLKINQSKIEFSREIGEKADAVTATKEVSFLVYRLDPQQKEQIVKNFLKNEEGFSEKNYINSNYLLSFDVPNSNLLIEGNNPPEIDQNSLKDKLVIKSPNKVKEIIRSEIPRTHSIEITINSILFKPLNLIPPINNNIKIQIKTKE